MLSVISALAKDRTRYDELVAEVARLRAILEPREGAWRGEIGLTPTRARLLWVLLQRDIATYDALCHALSHDHEYEDILQTVRCGIVHVRHRLTERFGFPRSCIIPIYGTGYKMLPEYRAMLRKKILKVDET